MDDSRRKSKSFSEYGLKINLLSRFMILSYFDRDLRCLKEYRTEDRWRLLWKQSKRAGQVVAKTGLSTFDFEPKVKSASPIQ